MRWLAWLAVGVVGVASVGCSPEETAAPLRCGDPAFGGVDEACGVWVSASLGSDDNPGTRDAPMASLSAAALKARDALKDVYACGEVWTEPLILPSDVSLYGGFDCASDWKYRGKLHHARIETAPGVVPLKTEGKQGSMNIFDFDFVAADAVEPGGSSIGVIVATYDAVLFRRCTLVAGRGADGLHGELLGEPAAPGASGKAGAGACSAPEGPGGEAVETACGEGETSRGGEGGSGGPLAAGDGDAGLPAPGEKDPNDPSDGDGGKGQTASEACTAGEPGAAGADGADAPPIPDAGRRGFVSIDGFEGVGGLDGLPGAPGQGGGGGGASRGGAAVCGAATPGGAGGGSGGAGGCGGKGGKGGQPGGSSFAILVLGGGRDVLYESCELWVGQGGQGGDGAPGQPGGLGGEPGTGGLAQGTLQTGCPGGKGGVGGKGGGGGGGNGGHSAHIAFFGDATIRDWPLTTFYGDVNGGLGGDGGDVYAPGGYNGEGTPFAPFSVIAFQQ